MKKFLDKVGKKIFNSFGFEIHRRGGLRTTMAEVLQHTSKLGFKPQTVIDVGVAYGTFDLYEKFPDSIHLLIEPLEEFETVLKDISRKYKADYVISAASAKPGKIIINVHSDLSSSSIYKEVEGSHVDGVPREVPAVTIDDICKERNLRGPYLIKIDIQGAELDVLNGARKVLKDTELIILEVQLFQFFVNGPQFYDIVSYMNDKGFVVYDIFNNCIRPLDGALASVDMAFVKNNGIFRQHHFYATHEQRKKMT